jgi:tripartite-type tricarboxylate transporter receptor subunit TctC
VPPAARLATVFLKAWKVTAFQCARTIALAGLCVLTAFAQAQTYPAKPIRIIVPVAPGGSSDILARMLGQRIGEQMGVSVIVENRPGAGTVIGTETVAKAPADGSTLLAVAAEFVINPSLRKLPYDPNRDFACVTQLASGQYFLAVHPAVPVKTPRQLIALAKSRAGAVTYGSAGPGSVPHLAGVLFQQMTGTRLVHVPYKSSGPASVALMSGEIDFIFINVASVIAQVKAGRVRAIAATGARRSPVAPEVPTLQESALPGFIVTGFNMLMVPGPTPQEIVNRLNVETVKALDSQAVREQLAALGLEPAGNSPAECAKLVGSEIARWAPVVKASGATAD